MKISRSRFLMSFIAVLILALALAACGGSEEPTPTPEPAPPTETAAEPTDEPEPTAVPTEEPEPTEEPATEMDFQEFSSDEVGLSMNYPTDWVSDTTFSDFLVFASSQAALESDEPGAEDAVALLLHGSSEDFGTSNPADALTEFIPEMDFGGEGLRGEIEETSINGNPAAIAIIDGETDSGTPLTAYLTIIVDGDWAAIFVATSPTEMEAEYLDTFEAMAETIELREPIMAEEPAGSESMGDSVEPKGFLLYGDAINDSLNETGTDAWEFIGLEGEVIDIMVEPASAELDVTLDILDENRVSLLDSPLDDSFGAEVLVNFEVPASTAYYIVISSYDGNPGDYTLTIGESGSLPVATDPGTDEVDDVSEPSDATPIAPGSYLELSEIYASTVDGEVATTLTFSGKAREFADISVSPLSEELDVVIDVLDPLGTSLLDAPLDDAIDSEYIRILRTPIDGEYTVVITSYHGNPGDFEILVEESYLSNPASFVFANGSIDDTEESHTYPFYTYTDELVVVQVDPDLDLDAVIQLYNDDTDELIQEEDASTGFEETIFFVPEDGNYSFRVIGYEGSTGFYEITLIGSEFVYFELATGDLVIGRFGDNNLFEYYIGGESGDQITFTAKTEDDIDLILELVDFDDNIMAGSDEGGTNETESFSYTFEEDSLLILRVSDFQESGTGEFILSVD